MTIRHTTPIVEKLKSHLAYFKENAGKWVDLADVIFPKVMGVKVNPCEDCGGDLHLYLWIPEELVAFTGNLGRLPVKIRYLCKGCGKFWQKNTVGGVDARD